MNKKKAKLKYMPNTFEIVGEGEYVLCSISNREILLENLNYWNVEEQEAYFSFVEAAVKRESKQTS